MAVTGSQKTEKALYLSQVEKIANSHTFHSAESLRKLLRYLADHTLEHPGAPLKEYQIATEVFGRPSDFDPQFDSAIRVQAGRLRMKLAEYYASEGANDSIQVEMPKGTYLISFHSRPVEAAKIHLQTPIERQPEAGTSAAQKKWMAAVICLSVLLLLAIVALVYQGLGQKASPAVGSTVSTGPLGVFWRPFVSGSEEPWVIFSNAAFVGRPETGMRYFNAARDAGAPIKLDHYTGVGEVLAVHALDGVFDSLHHQIRVKRGSLFSLDDAKNNDLIFVGSPAENLALRDIPGSKEFVFRYMPSGPRSGDLTVANMHPRSGEPSYFIGTPDTSPLSEDYAVIALVKGLDPARSVLILAGTTTIGTQAAVEFVCNPNSLRDLLQRLNITESSGMKPFEAVIRAKVARGVPVESDIVAFRATQ